MEITQKGDYRYEVHLPCHPNHLPEGEARTYEAGELVDCVLLDIPEEVLL